MTNVSIGGNVTDSVMVFGNNNYVVKIGDVSGGVVNIVQPSDKPKYTARSMPVSVRPRAFPALLDRETEFASIKNAVQSSAPVSVWGQQGIGKTSFIRYLSYSLEAGSFTSGVVYLNASGLGLEDLLQVLFDLFFESIPTYKPTTGDIRLALQNIKALVFLDDFQVGREEAVSILDAAPGCLFVLSSAERSLWGEGEVIPLQGLPESEAIKLFEKELSRPLSEQEKGSAIKICNLLKGHPLHILQMASLARDKGKSLEGLLGEITIAQADDTTLANLSMVTLGEPEKRVLALLAAAGGNTVALEHLKAIIKDGDVQKNIQQLMSLGLVEAHSPRFSLTGSLTTAIAATWDLTSWQDTLLKYAIDWLSQQPAGALVEESSGLLIYTLKNAGERKKWREVIQLGRALEKFMILYKRWQSWSDILNLILTAAKALNDSKTQAWALHQLGSRALYLGSASEAKTFLTQALNIRQTIGDKAGAAITQHNLNTLNGIIAPVKANTSGCRRYLTCSCGAVAAITVLALIVLIILFFGQPSTNNYPATEPPIYTYPTDTPFPTSTDATTPLPLTTATPHPTDTPTVTPVPTPIGGGSGRIAFVSNSLDKPNIFLMDIANPKPIEITKRSEAYNPTWSPDGSQIAFYASPDGRVIYSINADGSAETQLTDYTDDFYPTWSPDGKKIAFVSQRDGNGEIYVMNPDGSGQTRLTYNDAWDADPTWSPDSTQIAFVSNRDGDGSGFQIYVMNADGSGQTRLPNNRPIGTWNSFPNWSHDGSQIVFQSRDNANSVFQIYVMSVFTEDSPVQLTYEGENQGAKWSPDDGQIAFTSNRDGNNEVYIMYADGKSQINLTKSPTDDNSPAWEP